MSRFDNINPIFAPALAQATPHVPPMPAPKPAPTMAPALLSGLPDAPAPEASDRARVEADQAFVRETMGLGVDPAAQFFATGTKLVDAGHERIRQLRQEWEALPLAVDACQSLISRIAGEQRRDLDVRTCDLRLDQTGVLTHVDGHRIHLSDRAYSGLIQRAPKGSAAPQVARNVNAWIGRAGGATKIRTRSPMPDGSRHAYAVVSPSYAVMDLDAIAAVVAETMPRTARARVSYDGSRGEIDVSLDGITAIPEITVGQPFRVGLSLRTADDATGSIRAYKYAERVRCRNATLIHDTAHLLARKHVGSPSALRDLVTDAIAGVGDAIRLFADRWSEASMTALTAKESGEPLAPDEAFRRLIAHGHVHSAGTSAADMLDRLRAAYDAEPTSGVTGVLNAVTRAAHSADWASPWATRDLEDQAGVLLFARVTALAPIDPEVTERLFAA